MVEKFAKEHAADTRVIYVVSGSSASRTKEVADDRKIAVPVYADPDGKFSEHFKVEMTPTLLDFNSEGRLTGTYNSVEALPGSSESALPERRQAVMDSGREIGTSYDVVVMADDEQQARKDLAAAREVVHEAEKHLSEWKYDSDISRLNREAGRAPMEVHGDLLKLITASKQVSRATGGAFDITWMPLSKLWNVADEDQQLPSDKELAKVLAAVGYDKVVVDGDKVSYSNPDTQIGLGAVAKGWIVDAVFLELQRRGYDNLIVNIGGDLRTAGRGPDGPWKFKITDPYDTKRVAGSFDLKDGSVATSGNYLRYHEINGKRYGHILDPRTGRPAKFDGSVSVLTRDCAMADALATAMFVMGPEKGLAWVKKHPGVEVIYATRNGLKSSLNLKG